MKKLIFIFLLIPVVAFAQLPEIYQSDVMVIIGFNQPVFDETGAYFDKNIPSYQFFPELQSGDIVFAYITDEGFNKIVGKDYWYTQDGENRTGNIFPAFFNESDNPTRPDLKTGCEYGQEIYLGLKRGFNLFKLNIDKIYKPSGAKYFSETSQIKAFPIAMYIVSGVEIGEQLSQLGAIDYLAWKHGQCPALAITNIQLESTPIIGASFDLKDFEPEFTQHTSFNVVSGSGTIQNNKYIFSKEDLQTGKVDIKANAIGFSGCPGVRMFDCSINFPAAPQPVFETMTSGQFKKLCDDLTKTVSGNKLTIKSGSDPFPAVQIVATYHKIGAMTKTFFSQDFLTGVDVVIDLPPGWDTGSTFIKIYAKNFTRSYYFKPLDFK